MLSGYGFTSIVNTLSVSESDVYRRQILKTLKSFPAEKGLSIFYVNIFISLGSASQGTLQYKKFTDNHNKYKKHKIDGKSYGRLNMLMWNMTTFSKI